MICIEGIAATGMELRLTVFRAYLFSKASLRAPVRPLTCN